MTIRVVCVLCAHRHVIEALEAGRDPGPPPTFAETPEEHLATYHPTPAIAAEQRAELDRRIEKIPYEAFKLLIHDLGNTTPEKGRH